MFFPENIKHIKSNDYVLEIGPGGTPHPRSDILLEKIYNDPDEAKGQRGYALPLKNKYKEKIVYYNGTLFPFKDKEFNYVICSHVLEHVEDVDVFLSEIMRVGSKGYLEYPTIYYDYIYNFPEHKTFLFQKNNILYWMPKSESGLYNFSPVHLLFYESLISGNSEFIEILKPWMFQGFEWEEKILHQKTGLISELTYTKKEITFPVDSKYKKIKKLVQILKTILVR